MRRPGGSLEDPNLGAASAVLPCSVGPRKRLKGNSELTRSMSPCSWILSLNARQHGAKGSP